MSFEWYSLRSDGNTPFFQALNFLFNYTFGFPAHGSVAKPAYFLN
jgi:hypothetical protein